MGEIMRECMDLCSPVCSSPHSEYRCQSYHVSPSWSFKGRLKDTLDFVSETHAMYGFMLSHDELPPSKYANHYCCGFVFRWHSYVSASYTQHHLWWLLCFWCFSIMCSSTPSRVYISRNATKNGHPI